MMSIWAASHPSLLETGRRDDSNGANAAIAKRLIGAVSRKEKKIASRDRLLPIYSAGSPFLPL